MTAVTTRPTPKSGTVRKKDQGDRRGGADKQGKQPRPGDRPGPAGDKQGPEKPPPQQPGDPGKAKPAFSLTAKEFSDAYKAKPDEARAKYKGKLIDLLGPVGHLAAPSSLSPQPILKLVGDPANRVIEVSCVMADKAPWKKVTPGQTVKVRGEDRGGALWGCRVVEVTGPAAPTFTADQLSKECAADPDAWGRKYRKKWMVVTGEVGGVKFNEAGAADVTLKTAAPKPAVVCSFTAPQKGVAMSLRAGQKVKILAAVQECSEDEINLQDCIPME